MLITRDNLNALRTTFGAQFQSGFDSATTFADKISTETGSQNAQNLYGWIAQQLKARKWKGPRLVRNLSERSYMLENEEYEVTVGIPRKDIINDNLGIFANQTMPQVGNAIAKIPDDLVVSVMQNNAVCFDGGNFFATNHPTYDDSGSTYANLFGSSALDATNFNTVWAAMSSYVGEDGKPLGVNPNLLIVPPQLKRAALEIVNATFAVGAGGTNVTAENVLKGWADVLVIPELGNQPTVWYLADVSRGIMPFVKQVREPYSFVAKDSPTDDNVFMNNEFVYGGYWYGNVGVTLPFLIAKCQAAAL
jgi:phage major head subunit gpT-like protein